MSWDSHAAELRAEGQAMHEAREAGLSKCRLLIQTSAKAIRHIHRRQFEEAEKLLQTARSISADARAVLQPFPELQYAGYLSDAEKEMVEAHAVAAMVKKTETPTRHELNVGLVPYLNGMGEAASEARRYCLDEVRRGENEEAERILAWMESIYDELITFDFPDGMTGGLRRTCDALRAVIERTRSDLTLTASQAELAKELRLTRELNDLRH